MNTIATYANNRSVLYVHVCVSELLIRRNMCNNTLTSQTTWLDDDEKPKEMFNSFIHRLGYIRSFSLVSLFLYLSSAAIFLHCLTKLVLSCNKRIFVADFHFCFSENNSGASFTKCGVIV